jgi:protein-S-isoprenylcysteine O-methyltransferase Ste14
MSRALYLAVAAICYLAFFVAFAYLIGFMAALPQLPTNVDKGIEGPANLAIMVDIGLIAIFGLQHSVMARKGFKDGWTKIVPDPIERSVYCLATAAALGLMFFLWHPIAGSVWSVADPDVRIAIWTVFGLGWVILFIATHLINHFELFGLAQAWRYFRGTAAKPHELKMPLFYKWVRHPIYSGFFLAIWATPEMTYSHLLMAIGFSIYLLVGIHYEEKDLVGFYGNAYVEYRRKVGMVIPGIGRRA